jgi:hypothetical protein
VARFNIGGAELYIFIDENGEDLMSEGGRLR